MVPYVLCEIRTSKVLCWLLSQNLIYSPLDFLVSPRNRLVYSVLFAIMGTGLINDYGNFGGVLGGALEADDIFTTLFNKICEFTVLCRDTQPYGRILKNGKGSRRILACLIISGLV